MENNKTYLTLEEIVELRIEKVLGKKDPSVLYIGLEHIAQGEPRLLGSVPANESSSANSVFYAGDILFGKLRPNLRKSLQVDFDGYCTTEILVLQPRPEIAPRYAANIFQWEQIFQAAVSTTEGTRMPRTSWAKLRDFRVFVPPLPEQRRIAEILDAADKAIRATERVIAKLRQIKAGLLHDLLTRGLDAQGRLRDPAAHPGQFKDSPLGKIPQGWGIQKIGEFAHIKYGISSAIDQTLETGVPTITLPCVSQYGDLSLTKGLLAFTSRANVSDNDFLQRGDLLFNWRNGSSFHLGKTAYFDAKGAYTHVGFLLRIRTQQEICHSRYLWWRLCYMKDRNFFMRAKIQVNNTYNSGELATTTVILPSPDEQKRIVMALNAHDARIRAEEAEVAKLRQVKRGLMDDLLTGRVRCHS